MSFLIVHVTEHRAVYNILLARTIFQHSTSSGNFPEHKRNNTGFLINFENEAWFPFVMLEQSTAVVWQILKMLPFLMQHNKLTFLQANLLYFGSTNEKDYISIGDNSL
jgi:hypothetical protein